MMNTEAENFRNFNSIQFAFSHTKALFSIHGASCHKKPALSSAINTQPWLGLFSGWLQAQSVSVSGIGRFWYSTQNQSLLTQRAPIQTTSPSSVNWFGMQWVYMLIITLTNDNIFDQWFCTFVELCSTRLKEGYSSWVVCKKNFGCPDQNELPFLIYMYTRQCNVLPDWRCFGWMSCCFSPPASAQWYIGVFYPLTRFKSKQHSSSIIIHEARTNSSNNVWYVTKVYRSVTYQVFHVAEFSCYLSLLLIDTWRDYLRAWHTSAGHHTKSEAVSQTYNTCYT